MACTRGRSPSIRRAVKAAWTRRRSRCDPPGGTLSMCGAKAGQALSHDIGARGQRRVNVLGQPCVFQRRSRLLIADNQPRVVTVGQR